MSPLIKHLSYIRNKTAYRCSKEAKLITQEKINKLIRMNQVKAVSSERSKFGKGTKKWWEVANKITGRKAQGTSVSSVLSLNEINSYFQLINTDNNAYKAPALLFLESSFYSHGVVEITLSTGVTTMELY